MANQRTPTTDTVEPITVEKIVLSGSPFVSSVLGHGAYLISAPLAPAFYRNPIISGPVLPPSTLTCDAESFTSSPRAVITYQWKRDTVNISNETNQTFQTALSGVGDDITCEVTITNASGSQTLTSNIITLEAVQDGFVYQMDVIPIQGLSAPTRVDATDLITFYVQGIANNDKVDVDELDVNFIQGMVNDIKIDNNEMDVYAMNGVVTDAGVAIDELDMCAINGMATDDGIAVDEIDLYGMFHPILLTPLVVVNGDAEAADMTAWTMDTNTVTAETTAPGYSTDNREGAKFFVPEQLGQGVDSQMHQVIVIPGGDLADVDTGRTYCVVRFRHMSDEGFDKMVITLKALKADDTVLATMIYSPDAGPTDTWLIDNSGDTPLSLPTLTRKIKIIVLFDAHASSGTAVNSVYADDFQIEFMKTA